jgi:GT2 family glycosyltransferase
MIELPTPARPRASIIVVVSSIETLLHRCLERLARSPSTVSFETIVVLNGLPPGQASRLRDGVAGSQFEESRVNLGFAGALNQGRAAAQGEFIVSLHDDAEVQPDWLDALVETADRDLGAGAVGSLVLGRDQRVQAAGFELLQDGSTRPPWDGVPPTADVFAEARAVDYSPSCSLLVRASTWDRIGGADERLFPLYYVDVDICLAIRARGERVLLQPRSVVVHHGGASTNRDFAEFVVRRNRALMIEKWGELIRSHIPGSGATFSLADRGAPPQHADPDLLTRLRRDSAVAREYEADLRSRLAAHAAQLQEQRAHLDSLVAELESTRKTLLDREREYQLVVSALQTERGDREREAAEMTWLRQRSEMLTQIEQGGWWRLRGRVLPLLRAAAAARRVIGAARRKR